MTDTDVGVDREAVPVPPIPEPEVKSTATVARERVFVGTGLLWGLVVGVLLAVALVILAAQNTGSTTIAFLGWEFSRPLIVVILGTLLVAVVFDELFGMGVPVPQEEGIGRPRSAEANRAVGGQRRVGPIGSLDTAVRRPSPPPSRPRRAVQD